MNCLNCNEETKNPKFCSCSCAAKHNNLICKRREKEGTCFTCNISISSKNKYCKLCNENRLNSIKESCSCPVCGCKKDETSTRRYQSGRKSFQAYCKKCTAGRIFIYAREMKQKCVEYKGGKCELCGYDKCNSALDFHHRDPSEKDFSISRVATRRFDDEIKSELDKCDMICSNCHREVHSKEKDIKYLDYKSIYEKYKSDE